MKEFKIGGLEIFTSKTIFENKFHLMLLPSLDYIKESIKVRSFYDYSCKHYKHYTSRKIVISWLFFCVEFTVKSNKYDDYE